MREVVVWVLVGAGAALQLLAVAGIVLMREALDRLHYASPAALGGALLSAGVLVQGGWSLIGWRAILLAAFLLATGPVLAHATARAVHVAGERRR